MPLKVATMVMIMRTDLSEIRLWQLLSPALPIGGFSYSQGLETAVSRGWIQDAASASDWILGVGSITLPQLDLPFLRALRDALAEPAVFAALDQALLAHRETAELRAEDEQQGRALRKLLLELDAALVVPQAPLSLAAAFAAACEAFAIDRDAMLHGYAWLWFENQVAAATKLVPLGQSVSQRLLLRCGEALADLVARSRCVTVAEAGASVPGVMLASALHETEYSRHYRS